MNERCRRRQWPAQKVTFYRAHLLVSDALFRRAHNHVRFVRNIKSYTCVRALLSFRFVNHGPKVGYTDVSLSAMLDLFKKVRYFCTSYHKPRIRKDIFSAPFLLYYAINTVNQDLCTRIYNIIF